MDSLNVGAIIYHLRSAKQISQRELSSKVGVSHSYISHIENGTRDPSLNIVEKIAGALSIPVYVIFLAANDPIVDDPNNKVSFQKIVDKWIKS